MNYTEKQKNTKGMDINGHGQNLKNSSKNTSEKEIWKPVRKREGLYEVSNLGRVRSVTRVITTKGGVKRKVNGKILSQYIQTTQYFAVTLNEVRGKTVHRLVYEAFNGEVPKGYVVDHIDDNGSNNHLSNLQMLSHRDNIVKGFKKKGTTSKYPGVWKEEYGWRVRIQHKKKREYLGTFKTEDEAYEAYLNRFQELKS